MLFAENIVPTEPQDDDLLEIRSLFEAGLYMQAFRASQRFGDLASWTGSEALILGGRLASHLGAPRLARQLLYRAYRSAKSHPVAAYFRAARLLSYVGPFRTWKFLRSLPDFPQASSSELADLVALRARVLALFRDFERAEFLIAEALSLAPDRAWIWCEKAEISRAMDDQPAALISIERALALSPFYRPAVQVGAEILQSLNRDDEALSLLAAAGDRLESGGILAQRALLETEMELHEAALQSWQRADTLHPLAEPSHRSWLDRSLADAFYHHGQFELAQEYAAKGGSDFYTSFADRLKANPTYHRTILPVQFVAQHHLTCAPATMSALSLYWQVPIDHQTLAKEICYEGTYDHVERHWAEHHGFKVREFQLTWDTARALIDRGIPFALATVETTSAHLQAVIGYDLLRRTLLFREPSSRLHSEVEADSFLSRYNPGGPRCMVMIPVAEAHRLEGLVLPDELLYDAYHRLQRHLERHDRPSAQTESAWFQTKHPGHRLSFFARRRLALYDSNIHHELEAIDGLLALFPSCGSFRWMKAIALGRLASGQEEHRSFLKDLATDSHSEPVFWRDWGRELGRDGRNLFEARRYLIRAIRYQPIDADNLAELANSYWDERQFEKATELYRFAACLPGGGERFGRSYFLAARHVRKTDEALAFLRRRFDDFGRASIQPTRALYVALSSLDRTQDGLSLLDEALTLRPEDGELLLFAADEFARHGCRARGKEILVESQTLTAHASWLRVAALIAGYESNHVQSLAYWRQILEAEPMAVDALRSVAKLLAETEGNAASLRFLQEQAARFPYFLPFFEVLLEWMRDEPAGEVEARIRQALSLAPDSAWMLRELATNLTRQGKWEEAIEVSRQALSLEPNSSPSHGVLGHALRKAGRSDEAAEALRDSLRLSVDYTWGIHSLFAACDSFAKKKLAVDFVREQLTAQVVFGDGIPAFREEAYAVLEPDELLAVLHDALRARPDLWQTWISVVQQLVDLKRLDEALELATRASAAFPLLPRCWYELATVHRARGDLDQEAAAFSQALAINPAWGVASRGLASVYDRKAEFLRAREILEQAVSFEPSDAANHGALAGMLWRLRDSEGAVLSARRSLTLDPDSQSLWNDLFEWSTEMGGVNFAVEQARELTVNRAGESRSWFRLAEMLDPSSLEERLSALDQAAALDPSASPIYDLRAFILAHAGRFDEALDACAPAVLGPNFPSSLCGRRAWIYGLKGDRVTAIRLMRETLAASPDYYWGWERLAEWLTDGEEWEDALAAARNLARLDPRSSIPLGVIGDLYLRQHRRAEAKDAFAQAFKLDPGYEYAGFQLFDYQLKTGDRSGAHETLRALGHYHPGARTDAAKVALACRMDEKTQALDGLRALCFTPARTTFALRQAATAIQESGWSRQAKQIFKSVLDEDAANPEVGAIWVEVFTQRRFWFFSHRRLLKISPDREIGLAARRAYISAATTAKRTRLLRSLIHRDGDALRRNTECWGMVGYSLTTLEFYRRTVEWMHDWRDKSGLHPWMLLNLALSLRVTGDDVSARDVSVKALTLKGDHTTQNHQIFAAWDEALSGKIDAARARLALVPADSALPYFQIIRRLAQALIAVLGADPDHQAAEFSSHRTILQQASWKAHFNDPSLRRMGQLTVAKMANTSRQKTYRLGDLWPALSRMTANGWIIIILSIFGSTLLRQCTSASN